MRTLNVDVAGASRPVYYYDGHQDEDAFCGFLWEHNGILAVDSETTGLDPYEPGFELRLVQFGTPDLAWVVPYSEDTKAVIMRGLHQTTKLVIHNAAFDLLVFDAVGLLDLDVGWAKVQDTKIMAHLLDPRGKDEGGTGAKLENLADAYFEHDADRFQRALFAYFAMQKWKREDGYRMVAIDCPEYVAYSGVDVLLTSRLYDALAPEVGARFGYLSEFEHEVARVVSGFERKGMLVDTTYAATLIDHYAVIEADAKRTAATFGITKLGSRTQVPEVLTALGANLIERTPSGIPKVDKAVLLAIIDNNHGTPLAQVAEAIHVGKNAGKWSTTYVQATLDRLDGQGRVHPKIKALEARTARMSVSSPPLQQLPSGDWRVRRMFIADPGMAYFSVDYSQIELRILAALANEPTMLKAINDGQDLHDVTATLLYGDGFTKAQRKLAKNTNFGEVFGGGAVTLARQAGVSLDEAKAAKDLFKRGYPAITRYSTYLRDKAEGGKVKVVTPSGRELPLDRDRLYSATNYVVQSTARDVMAQALLDLDAVGLTQYLNLVIHDEVLGQAPVGDVVEIANEIARVMTMNFMDRVMLTASSEVYGPSWGHGYGAPS